jgi:lipoprotein-releasing system permease protein
MLLISRYERMIARRYLLPGRSEAFIAVVAGFSLVAVMLGVAALIVVMSVMNGFRAELFNKITGLNGHAVVQGYGGQLRNWREVLEEAKKTPGITSAVPLIEQPLFATYNGRAEAIQLRGMRMEDILGNATLKGKEVIGSLKNLKPGGEQIAIGSRLAESLGATVGSEVSILNPAGAATPFGTMPRIVKYKVAVIFEVGVYDYDKVFAIMPIEDAQTLLLLGDGVSMIELETNAPDKVGDILQPLNEKVSAVGQVTDWRQMNSELFEALAVDRTVSFTILSLILLVAAFNVASTLFMLVRSKTRDIAVLRTMGASRASLMRIFVTVGTAIGVVGVAAGGVLGFLFITFREYVVKFIGLVTGQNIWDPSMRFLTELPAQTDPFQTIGICVMAVILCFLAALYPAWKAATTDPVEVLRYE